MKEGEVSLQSSGVGEKRIGVMGGTFDPPHLGHLIMAEEAAVELRLERVLFAPAGMQPFKLGEPVTPAEHRVRMVELAIGGNPCFALTRADVERPGPSYTVHLLEIIQRQLGREAELFFILGADSLADLPSWREPSRILELARVVAAPRRGAAVRELSAPNISPARLRDRVIYLDAPVVDVSSTELRDRVREGRPIRYLVPDAVEQYIREHSLYRDS